MSDFQDNLFDKIQKDANVNPEEIYNVANSVKHADFSDEETVRNLVQQLALIADKPISKAKEDQIVQSITNNSMPMDMQTLNQMFKK
ncbi:stage VI sporulation protein F [Virgibacillus doumboii]|uniref:stage VI sporulation protein F n=1 Tax=Virgibacillus doumboii TaxID=2697503 RepID=UPI0013DFB233|nr:stage VI sporulation protein F [Virgibacillus doumboii]